MESKLSKTMEYAVGHRTTRTEDSRADPRERDEKGQLERADKLIHQVKCRRVQSKYQNRQQTQNGRSTINRKGPENQTKCEDDRNRVAG